MYRDKDVSESTMTITNPNSVAVKARAIVLLSDPTMDPPAARVGKLVEYGIPSKRGVRGDGGIDYSVAVSPVVPAGATVQVAARRLATPPPTVKALYGYAVIEPPPAVFGSCDFPVTGADPFKLLPGYTQTEGCTDPARGC